VLVLQAENSKVKRCRFKSYIRCFWATCGFLDFKGNVRVCRHHPNPSGRFRRKEVLVFG